MELAVSSAGFVSDVYWFLEKLALILALNICFVRDTTCLP